MLKYHREKETMKIFCCLLLLLVIQMDFCRGQEFTEPGWFCVSGVPTEQQAESSLQSQMLSSSNFQFSSLSLVTTPEIAEAQTDEIQALARGLENDPRKIFYFVRDHIDYVHYFGSKKGAQLTLLERCGNDFDQNALLVALLRSAGYTASYEFGTVAIPFQNSTTNHLDIKHWLNLRLENTNWVNTKDFMNNLRYARGFPYTGTNGNTNEYVLHHVWVHTTIGGTNYALDPSFKIYEPIVGLNLSNAMGLNTSDILSDAAGTNNADYVQGLKEADIRHRLRDYTSNFIAFLQLHTTNASVDQVIGGKYIAGGQMFGASLPYTNVLVSYASTNLNWDYIPTNFMTTLSISVDSSNCFLYMPQLQGKRLSLTFDTNGLGQLWLDDDLLLQKQTTSAGGSTVYVDFSINHPHGDWDFGQNSLNNQNYNDQNTTRTYQRTNASYAISYAFEANKEWLFNRQRKLDLYRAQGLSDTSREVTTETLNVMGLSWMLQGQNWSEILASSENFLPQYHHRLGRMAQEYGKGYYIDVYQMLNGTLPSTGYTTNDQARRIRMFELGSYFLSADEHALIEQLQSSNLIAASTMKILQLANTNNQKIFLAQSNNWTSVRTNLVNYDTNDLSSRINAGAVLLLPSDGSIALSGPGSWAGYGIVQRLLHGPFYSISMLIGGLYGGYVSDVDALVNPTYISQTTVAQPFYLNPVPPQVINPHALDPVSMADGYFELSSTDLTLGQADPRGISFNRSYSSNRRNHNLVGMANGWLHNYYLKATDVSAPLASFGDSTPAQMAPLIVATKAAFDLYDTGGNAKNWVVTALIAKWGLDQTINNAVSIALGPDTIQFIKQPDGSYTPPAGSTMTLSKSRGEYFLKERNGRTFQFDPFGKGLYIFDQYNQFLSLSYTNASNWVSTVKDWKNRQFTFNYSGSPLRLTSVTDNSSPSRTVSFGYSTNGTNLDLTSVVDVENKTNRMVYDTNHQMIATINALNQMVVSNVYDGFGRVTDQYTCGDTNQHWELFWSGFSNVQKDPTGGITEYEYDDKHRLIRLIDPLNRQSQTFYDGQDHAIMKVSPLGEIQSYAYDANHNLLQQIDPLGNTNRFVYDGQNQLIQSIDPLNHTNFFGWNTQHSLEAMTNAIGDWVHTIYNSDGTISNKTDVAGVTTFSYDAYGQVNAITYPTVPTTTEGFLNSSMGDVLSHTNARQFVTSFQYNARRQLTNTTAPTNIVLKTSYDAVGNPAVVMDAKSHGTTNFWSPTQKLLGNAFPAVATGTRQSTNVYDSRDWLQSSSVEPGRWTTFLQDSGQQLLQIVDPLSRTNFFGYDANGRRIASTNAAFETNGFVFNGRGELVKSIDAGTHSVLHQFDAVGNQMRLTNRNGKVWQFQYDAANRLTNTTSPLLRSTTNGWNNRGLLASTREPSGQTATFLYDAMKRLTNRSDAVSTLTYDYDANGNQLKVSEGSRNLNWTYDAYDRISTYTDADGNLLKYYYDQNGNLTNLVYPDNRSVSYFYDNLNQLTNVTDWAQRKTLMAYDLAGRLTNIIRFNGTVRDIQYDAAGQATNIVERTLSGAPLAYQKLHWNNAARMDWEFMAPMPHPYTQPGRTNTVDDDNRIATFNGQSVIHDLDGNMTSGPLLDNSFVGYGYNARNQLTSVVSVASISSAIFATNGSSTYNTWGTAQNGYGPVNLKTPGGPLVTGVKLNGPLRNNYEGWVGFKFVVGPGGMTVTQLGRWVTAGNNQSHTVKLVSASGADISGGSVTVNTFGAPAGQFAYGTLASPITLSANTTYFVVTREYLNGDQWWDYTSQLSGPGTWTFNYDPAGNRVGMTNGTLVTKFVINPNAPLSQTLVRTKPDGSKTFYVYGPGLLYEVNETSSGSETSTETYHYDSRGSTVALTDGSGYVGDRIEYSAYGTITYRAGNTDTPFLFNGRYGVQTDPNGLLYMRARYYNPYLCRFINSDPSGFSGGLNFYAFADGNPITLMDPFGLHAVGEESGFTSWLHGMGQVYQGYGDALAGFAGGIANMALHPIDTAQGIVNAAINPGQTARAIWNGIGDTFADLTGPDPRAAGKAMGDILITAGTALAPLSRASEIGSIGDGAAMFSRELGSPGPRASTELLDAMRAHGRTVTIAGEGSEELRFLNAVGAEASVGGPGHMNIILRENPSRAAAMEEFLHGTQDRLGIIDRLGIQGAENHVADFMTRHKRLLGL